MSASPSLAAKVGTRRTSGAADEAGRAPAWLVGLAFALWVVLLRAPFLGAELTDDPFYVQVGDLWRHGHLPYVAIFDVKPPGYFFLVTISQAVFGATLGALRAVDLIFDIAATLGVLWMGRRFLDRRVALFGAALYPVLSLLTVRNSAYPPLGAFAILAFCAALSRLRPVPRALLAGLLIGAAFTVKLTAAFEGLMLFALLLAPERSHAARIRVGAAFLAAAAAPALAFAAYFAANGAFAPLWNDAVIGALARASGAEDVTFLHGAARYFVIQRSMGLVFLLACASFFRRAPIAAAFPDFPVGVFQAWFAVTGLTIVLQRSLGEQYCQPTLAAALLLAGAVVVTAPAAFQKVTPGLALAAVALASLVLAFAVRGGALGVRQADQADAGAVALIAASGPRPDDQLYVVNRGLRLNALTGLAEPTIYQLSSHTLCAFPTAGPEQIVAAFAKAPRYAVIADRTNRYFCERPEAWATVDAEIQAHYRRLGHSADDHDSYDVYERR